jgi:hypothetical protein
MKIFILFAIFGAASASLATLKADLEEKNYKRPNFEIAIDHAQGVAKLRTTGNCDLSDPPESMTWYYDEFGNTNSAQVYEQCEYYTIAPAKDRCTSNVDLCENGFSVVAKVKPKPPTLDKDNFSWLFNFGSGTDNKEFGIWIGFQNAQVVARVITSKWINIIECNLESTEVRWFTLVVSRGPSEHGPIKIFVDNVRLTACPTEYYKPNNDPPTGSKKSNEIVIGGGRFSNGVVRNELYAGLTDQVCFFDHPLDSAGRKTAQDEGCFAV